MCFLCIISVLSGNKIAQKYICLINSFCNSKIIILTNVYVQFKNIYIFNFVLSSSVG